MLAAICTGVFFRAWICADLYARFLHRRRGFHHALRPGSPSASVAGKKSRFALDAVIVFLGTLIVSGDMDSMIYGMIVTFLMAVVMDKVMYGISAGKMALIITEHARENRRSD